MSRKKHSSKVELLQEFVAVLEELRTNLDMDLTGIEFSRLEESDYVNMIETPFNELMISAETFLTNLDNGIYDDDSEKEFEDE